MENLSSIEKKSNPKCDNAKNRLQEFCQCFELPFPQYTYGSMNNVRDDVTWQCLVKIPRKDLPHITIIDAMGFGATKKEASMNAAAAVMHRITRKFGFQFYA